MKKVSTKAILVLTIMVASFSAAPMMVAGYDYDDDYYYDQFGITDPASIITGFSGGFGSIFRGLGYGGNYLGLLFEMLLMQTLTNFSGKEMMPGVYVLSASIEDTKSDVRDFTSPKTEQFLLPYGFNRTLLNNTLGYAYCDVTTSGTYNYNLTVGASVTLIIWDNDGSFVNAVKEIIAFFHKIRPYMDGTEEIPETMIREGVELISWFLIHINDIFTGEELFVLNPITWQKLEVTTSPGFSITKEWKLTGSDWEIGGPVADIPIKGSPVEPLLTIWNETAKIFGNSYMEWLLTETDDVGLVETVFTSFTFDLIQLWIKNFYISIDVGEIMGLLQGGGSGQVDIASIFQGLDIEFYLFTHHLTGTFLYNDTNMDNKVSANYVRVNNSVGAPVLVDGRPVHVPFDSELTDRLILGTVADFDFHEPAKNSGENSISWGLTLDDPTITPVPVGVDLDSYIGAAEEQLEYIHFGFTFEPKTRNFIADDGGTIPVLHGAVKLDQLFAPWNDPITYGANNDIAGLDMAVIYTSTVLHFHLNVETLGDDPDDPLDPADDYEDVTHSLKIGNYLGKNIKDKLDFVDIAGPDYTYGAEGSTSTAPATTNILPVALFEVEANAHETFEGDEDVAPFAADIGLNITFNVMVYAVCFPNFGDQPSTGPGIWHDPTFSVFMVFDAPGFWALILLISGVGLVGVATILIKRRKDNRF